LAIVSTTIIAVLALLGFFVSDESEAVQGFQWILVNWAVTIAAFAMILGLLNLWAVHLNRMLSGLRGGQSGFLYSLALMVASIGVLAVGLWEGPAGSITMNLFTWIIAPLQAAIAALLLFVLTYSAYRLLTLRRQLGVFLFLAAALVVLIAQVPLPGWSETLSDVRTIWLGWLATPGLRGVLLGVALGTVMMAFRWLLTGFDRSYSPDSRSDE
jgi:hypothetical protein